MSQQQKSGGKKKLLGEFAGEILVAVRIYFNNQNTKYQIFRKGIRWIKKTWQEHPAYVSCWLDKKSKLNLNIKKKHFHD